MAFELPPLPYAQDALAPFISAQTLEFHHGKHHNAYVTKLNDLVKDTPMASQSLEEVIKGSFGKDAPLFNNSAQVWNHTFFWNCMRPAATASEPSGDLKSGIEAAFGSLDAFKAAFKDAAVGQFGSGWAWLVAEGGSLKITKTPNAENPMVHGQTALLTVDVWEHAYYLDYQNRRPDFVQAVLDNLVNWDFVAANLAAA